MKKLMIDDIPFCLGENYKTFSINEWNGPIIFFKGHSVGKSTDIPKFIKIDHTLYKVIKKAYGQEKEDKKY